MPSKFFWIFFRARRKIAQTDKPRVIAGRMGVLLWGWQSSVQRNKMVDYWGELEIFRLSEIGW